MVRVFYEPPPFGPGTDLNRTAYGVGGGGSFRGVIERLSKAKQVYAIGIPIAVAMCICYIPLSKYRMKSRMSQGTATRHGGFCFCFFSDADDHDARMQRLDSPISSYHFSPTYHKQ
jgi:hypothetical protein